MGDFVETLFIGWGVWYTGYNYRVNCKSEGNIFWQKTRKKVTITSAKRIVIKKGHFPAESRSYESNDIIGQNYHRGRTLRQKEPDGDCKIDPQKPPTCIERDPKKWNTNSRERPAARCGRQTERAVRKSGLLSYLLHLPGSGLPEDMQNLSG